ncbi:YdbH domain-containing protein [Sphingomonas sp. SORGH_AS_0879]|uniref:YdbH domain-containing protein n=1 Tax=Sphingomonas sp. SORGH_AS_0879 TaxID=3041790 RepID=UPI0027898B1E|nr:YdbH domain-containing protein [Sphingomonas sp. SORGH_AS_0879]MDQ1232064.1 translocation and assembly module TamB [Sphingomonas sp. SORGH_AS_0879]
MEGANEEVGPRIGPTRRFRRLQHILIAIALILLVALIALWIARKSLAGDAIDRALAERGVPARYKIADLGLGRQRLTDVVIGDPAHPDLVADWLETRTRIGLSGPVMTGVRAGRVRLRGRLVDGRITLGTLDRLMGPPSGKPFALPALDVVVQDGGIRLDTPQGLIGLSLSGQGVLSDGFTGRLGAVAPRLTLGNCVASGLAAPLRVRIVRERPTLTGPVRLAGLECGEVTARRLAARVDVTLAAALDRWQGRATLNGAAIRHPALAGTSVDGTIDFAGDAAATGGRLAMTARGLAARVGRAERGVVEGRYLAGRAMRFDGRMRLGGAQIDPALLARTRSWSAATAATPVGPVVRAMLNAAARSGRRFAADLRLALDRQSGPRAAGLSVRIPSLALASDSGGRIAFRGETGLVYDATGLQVDTTLATGGGGLPAIRATLRQAAPGAPILGTAALARYEADGAALAFDRMQFRAAAHGETAVTTRMALSGPISGGRIDGLVLPIAARWDGGLNIRINPDCQPLAIDRLALSGLRLDRVATRLCPLDGALVRLDGTRLGGGARLGPTRVVGQIGSSPLTVAAATTRFALADRSFALTGVESRIGRPESPTRIDAANLTGRITPEGIAGRFDGGAGQIGQIPLLLQQAAGDWRLAGGKLSLNGDLQVRDARAESPRFLPMAVRGVALTLAGNRIDATGQLFEPTKAVKVADITIRHALDRSEGMADLAVPGISFTKEFQPELLTPVTKGVIEDVRGKITGQGRIDWDGNGVRSTGQFGTDGIDLAAALGPVSGIAGTIRFTDLLALESAPGQVATVKTINPGIQVTNGVVRYQTLSGARVRVESGRWPFAGGTLTLDPTLLDFSQPVERRMTFHVEGAAADQFLLQFDFQNLNATGVFDGTLPMIFDERGGRIEGGRLVVRPGGGSIAYLGEISQKDLGLWGNLAFGALRSLNYRSLRIDMNGPLAGEMVTDVRFAGISQGKGAKTNFLIRRLQRLPFVFNVRIKAPFRGLLDSAQSFYDPRRLIQRNLPALLDEQNKRAAPPANPPIQPSASETVP